MAVIRPSDLPAAATVSDSVELVIDTGAAVEKATPGQIVDAAIPLASQAEAEAGTDNAKRVTPLRVAQAIEALGVSEAALVATGAGQGAELVGYKVDPSATARLVKAKLDDLAVSVKDFGAVGDGSTDDTAAIQAAIDFALNSDRNTVYAPAGHYIFSSLSFVDTVSGDLRAERGKIRFVGDGPLAYSDTYGTTTQRYGTILESTIADATNALTLAPGGTLGRQVKLENFSLFYGGTGYAVYAEYLPEAQIKEMSIRVTSAGGKALYLQDVFFGLFDRIFAICAFGTVSTVAGLTIDNSLFAGDYQFTNSVFDNFNDGIYIAPGPNVTNVVFDNCCPQKFRRYGLFCEAPVWNLVLRDHYTESDVGVSAVKIAPTTGSLNNFRIDGMFVLGGTDLATWFSGPVVDLAGVTQFNIEGVKYRQPWTSFINLGANVTSGTIDGIDVQHSAVANLPVGPLYMITGTNVKQGIVSLSNNTITSSTKLAWQDGAIHRVARHDGKYTKANAFSVGRAASVPLAVGVYNWEVAEPRPMVVMVTATGAGDSGVRLPVLTGVENGDIRIIQNLPASTRGVDVRDFAGTSIGYVIPVGGAAMCIADTINSKWSVLPFAVGAYGP